MKRIFEVVPNHVLSAIIKNFQCSKWGDHGVFHWSRVLSFGHHLAEQNGADKSVITAFALFHDAMRFNEHLDPDHGSRGAVLLQTYGAELNLTDDQLRTAICACEGHTHITHSDDLTIATCWDSDRLDLPRVGIETDPYYLNTDLAKDLLRRYHDNRLNHTESELFSFLRPAPWLKLGDIL